MVKVIWQNQAVEEAIWELKEAMKQMKKKKEEEEMPGVVPAPNMIPRSESFKGGKDVTTANFQVRE